MSTGARLAGFGSGERLIMDDHERQLWDSYHADRSDAARNALVIHFLPYVRSQVAKFVETIPAWAGVEAGDLVNDLVPALIDLIKRFDLSRRLAFTTFASQRLCGAMRDAMRERDFVPRSVRIKLKKDPEYPVPSIVPMCGDDDTCRFDNSTPLQYRLPAAPEKASEGERSRFWAAVCRGLDKTDRLILLMYYREQKTMAQIGESLGVSESRVSQRMKSIKARLAQREGLRELRLQAWD
jgi:RNA polymerase sigma factor FliA